ncbi:MAG: redoxin domain-containing protein [Deltaproteobacteria bacterium]|nr:redoxin domain-containing protein [Deltaproteobacteria bacterium]
MKLSLKLMSLVLMCLILIGWLGKPPVSAALEAGDKAPDFKLPGTTGVDISLSDFKGKKFVLIEFYGAAFVPT